jgi:hypothetical protein
LQFVIRNLITKAQCSRYDQMGRFAAYMRYGKNLRQIVRRDGANCTCFEREQTSRICSIALAKATTTRLGAGTGILPGG